MSSMLSWLWWAVPAMRASPVRRRGREEPRAWHSWQYTSRRRRRGFLPRPLAPHWHRSYRYSSCLNQNKQTVSQVIRKSHQEQHTKTYARLTMIKRELFLIYKEFWRRSGANEYLSEGSRYMRTCTNLFYSVLYDELDFIIWICTWLTHSPFFFNV